MNNFRQNGCKNNKVSDNFRKKLEVFRIKKRARRNFVTLLPYFPGPKDFVLIGHFWGGTSLLHNNFRIVSNVYGYFRGGEPL